MRLYNSQSQQVEELVVLNNHVGVYCCGVTPYDTTHLGHLFTFLTFDILNRYLRFLGHDVTYVQNVTDIDDDILRKSRELGMDWQELAKSETAKLHRDLKDLNAQPFDHFVAATDHIPQMQELITSLIAKDLAYESNGSVYFSVEADPDFGKVSHLQPQEWLPIANDRGNFPDDPNKRAPLDFVLWQAMQEGEPFWESPWGPGRPGWHIECSAMSMAYLGNTIDIHGGGYDLLFPHHECETAQSEGATGVTPFTRYWMHVAMVGYAGEKMSKSLGNLVLAGDMVREYGANTLRLALFSNHYRTPWEFMRHHMDHWAPTAKLLDQALAKPSAASGPELDVANHERAFLAALDNDLDTPEAINQLVAIANLVVEMPDSANVAPAQESLRKLADILGLIT